MMMATQTLDWANDPVKKLRQGYKAQRAAIASYSAPDVAIEETKFSSGTGLKFTPKILGLGADILYFHGGGWIVGSPWTHRTLCSWMAKFTAQRVFAAPYDLAPEHKFPAQANQAAEITNHFLINRKKIFLAGDSAGGAMALWAADGVKQKSSIQGIVSLYGAFGCMDGPSHASYSENSLGLNISALRAMYHYLGCDDVSEFRARFSQSGAPLLLVKAEFDPIAGDNDWMAQHTKHPVTHLLAAGQPHAYLQACGNNSEVDASMLEIANWIKALV
jgi:acetyl esterase/lipase